ncbi:DUF4249 domain-containing protein [Membranihabitans marinus]|uniref:DUF4249 domain-containing protein n=1 Tax=Membranihabitans marinus TaxID=1227546 RepID=UPI001F18A709|nr:DUF4249 domain-containing protein [Membranihabitans marinus]
MMCDFNRPFLHLFSFVLITCLFFCSCDRSIVVPVDLPVYQPHLLIYGHASPQNGARVEVQYNRPLQGLTAVVPPVPPLEVYLLESGIKKYKLTEDSTGYFSLLPEEIQLNIDETYSISVHDLQSNRVYESLPESLPVQPIYSSIELAQAIDTNTQVTLVELVLGKIEKPIGAYTILTSPSDSTGQYLDRPTFSKKLLFMDFSDALIWDSKPEFLIVNITDPTDPEGRELASYINVETTYFSEAWILFQKDNRQFFSFGEDIYQTVQPIYSNIPGNHGVFGLYNEYIQRVKIEY